MLDETPRSSRAITALRLAAIPAHAGPHEITVTAVGRWEEDLESVMVETADGKSAALDHIAHTRP